MEWIVALIALSLLLPLTIAAIVALKKSGLGRGGFGGAALAIGLVFGGIFDPASRATVETIQKKKETGDADLGESGELVD